MKQIGRFVSLAVLVLVLALGSALPVFGQDGGDLLCNGLSDADCQLIMAAGANMQTVTSFAAPAWEIRISFTDGTDNFSFNASGTAAFQFPTMADEANPLAGTLVHLVINDATLITPDETQTGATQVILTDDMAYIEWEGEWYGDPLDQEDMESTDVESVQEALQMFTGGELDPEALLGVDLTAAVSTARGMDEAFMGQNMAAFTTTVDFIELLMALLQSPMVGEALGGEVGMSPEELSLVGVILAPMMQGTSIEVNQWIGVDDQQYHMIEIDAALNLNMAMFDPESGAIAGELYFMSQMADVNQPVSAPIPATYRPGDELDLGLDADRMDLDSLLG